ncbi:MAG: ABC transporter permease [Planctomycetes bacterium]|nr:ABC transporter permease [Planctomycetota bacterium]
MTKYLIKRVLMMIPTMLGISIIVFSLIRFAPGDPISLSIRGEGGALQADQAAKDELIKMRKARYGLDKSIPVQYGQWLRKITTGFWKGDLGVSITEKRPVTEMIGERIGLTIRLNVISSLLIYTLAIPIGLVAAKNRYSGPLRRAVFDTGSGVAVLILYSVPAIVLGLLLIVVFARGGVLEGYLRVHHPDWLWVILPLGGVHDVQADRLSTWSYLLDEARHLLLPVITLTLGGLAYMAKLSRTSLLENLRMDYVRTARAKGLRERTVVYVHAVRNSLLPMITVMAYILPGLIGGSIIIEHIFGLPGMGQLFYQAVIRRDYTMIEAISIMGAVLTLAAILIADILLAVADPRVRYD